MNTRFTDGKAVAGDGTVLAYRLWHGPAGSSRLALVHSLAMDRHFWEPVASRLAGTASVLAFDCRGHGESGKPPGPYAADRFASDLAAVMDHAGWASATVAGASMGGSVCVQFAGTHPARTEALGLIDTTAHYGEKAPEEWEARAKRALESGLADLVEFQKTRWFSDAFRTARPDVVDASVATFLRNDLGGYAGACRMLGAFDGRLLLSSIRVPTAVVVGEEDYATPVAMARALHEGIAGATLEVIAGARHLTPLEVPDRVARALVELLDRRAKEVSP